jgi:hypothetical protein
MAFRFIIAPALVVFLLSPAFPSDAAEPLDRSFESLKLGMTDEAFLAAAPSVEMRDAYLNLVPDERFFRVKGEALPKGVAELAVHLYRGHLYKIAIAYVENWFDDTAWDSMVESGNRRYGKAQSDQRQLGEGLMQLARWEDKATVYIIRRQMKPRFRDQKFVKQSTVYITYLDKALWDERLRAEGSLF